MNCTEQTLHDIHAALIDWYGTHKRALPWRETRDPYLIWVSEVILQQTRVVQGTDYYHRFVAQFPTVTALAAADLDEVLSLWQGLGYYSRARNMHKAAQVVANMRDGIFPKDYKTLLTLPGVGDYTAAAVSSFAADAPHAAVDGNLLRVVSRLLGSRLAIDLPEGKAFVKQFVQSLVELGRSAEVNQSLMELGALICLPREALCAECPLAEFCAVTGTGRETELPLKSRKVSVKPRYMLYLLAETEYSEIWLRRREGKDIWRGLYEMPLYEAESAIAAEAVTNIVAEQWGVTIAEALTGEQRRYKHRLSHRLLDIIVVKARVPKNVPIFKGFISVKRGDITTYGMPIILSKAIEDLL